MTLGKTWYRKIYMALIALWFLFILNFLAEILLLSNHSFLIFILFWTDFIQIVERPFYLFFIFFHLLVFVWLFLLLRLARGGPIICWWSHLCFSFLAVHQMLLDVWIIRAQRSFAVITLDGRSLTFIEKMVADERLHHYFFASLALITPVITIFVKLFIDKLMISQFCGTPIEFTAKLQFIVIQVYKPYVPIIID